MIRNAAMFSSKRQNWGTPDDYFRKLHKICRFTTDACASIENAKLSHFITAEGDGINYRWFDLSVFYNPEYRFCDVWVPKARNEAIAAPGFSVGLVPFRPDPDWWSVGVLSEDGAAGRLRRSFYDAPNRILWLRWDRLITGIHSVPDRLPFKDPKAKKLRPRQKPPKPSVAPFPSAVIFHFNPATRPPTRRWLLERFPG